MRAVTPPLPHRPRRLDVPLPERGPLPLWAPAGAEAILETMYDAPPDPDDKMPYWADLWPSALGLATALDAGGVPVAGRRVLELGCGLGLGSLAAARAGAAEVMATDWDEDALRYVEASAALSGLAVQTSFLDWRRPPPELAREVIIAADVLYEERNAPILAEALPRLLAPGGVVWIADPGRPYIMALLRALGGWRAAQVGLEIEGSLLPKGRAKIDLFRLEPGAEGR